MDKETREFLEAFAQGIEKRLDGAERKFETLASSMNAKFDAFTGKVEGVVQGIRTGVQKLDNRVDALEQDMVSLRETVEHTDGVVTRLENELLDDVKMLREDHLTTKQRVTRLEKHLKLPQLTAADVKL